MSSAPRGTILTYATAAGDTWQAWNSRDGVVPDHPESPDGQPSWHSGPDEYSADPPGGMARITDWTPALRPPPVHGRRMIVGWPGMPVVVTGV
jgi:hypothetical protein